MSVKNQRITAVFRLVSVGLPDFSPILLGLLNGWSRESPVGNSLFPQARSKDNTDKQQQNGDSVE